MNHINKRSGFAYAVTAASAISGWVTNMASNSAGAIYNNENGVKQVILQTFLTCFLEYTLAPKTVDDSMELKTVGKCKELARIYQCNQYYATITIMLNKDQSTMEPATWHKKKRRISTLR